MRVRRLQYLNEDGVWVNQAYVIEDNQGELSFYYNTLTWGRVGAPTLLKKSGKARLLWPRLRQ
ncbi:MAG: hypothetical protein KDJ65_37220 [Anaerolineae bacterium]|nr:hypothetical protein [Anaerolineae bacterium]